MEPVNQSQDFWTKSPEVEWSFECIWEQDRTKTPGTANRQTECTGCPQGSPKGFPALILPQRAGDLHIKALSLSKNQILGKKEVFKMAFFTTAVTGVNCE